MTKDKDKIYVIPGQPIPIEMYEMILKDQEVWSDDEKHKQSLRVALDKFKTGELNLPVIEAQAGMNYIAVWNYFLDLAKAIKEDKYKKEEWLLYK